MSAHVPRPPDYLLKVKHPEGTVDNRVGALWVNEAGHLTIRLWPGTVLRWDDGLMITAFPRKDSSNAS